MLSTRYVPKRENKKKNMPPSSNAAREVSKKEKECSVHVHLSVSDDGRDDDVYDDRVHFVFSPLFARVF